jgi:D-mannonate dehydratase
MKAMWLFEKRYLKKNTTKLCRGQIYAVYAKDLMVICTHVEKPRIYLATHLRRNR